MSCCVAPALSAQDAAPPAAEAAPETPSEDAASRVRSNEVEQIVVTARRMEESIQDVPISITAYSQDALDQRNIFNSSDLATYTPSLTVNTRFGPDQASFAIRGFTQELRTTASVAFYFADVVAPRGGGSIVSGDGGGPGSLFDLQNVQVLKGPQGTLFGRNTTGGAILVVPQKPTDQLEGYVEGSLGDYDMQRLQGVINVPLSDWARARFGIDYQDRNGYVDNISDTGPDSFNDVGYLAGRASLVLDLADSLENYTIFSFTDSENNGSIAAMFACNYDPETGESVAFGSFCAQQLANESGGFYTTANAMRDGPYNKLEQWQLINTTTWAISDRVTAKNILSYADLEQTTRSALFGSDFVVPEAVPLIGGLPFWFTNSDQLPGYPTNSQTSLIEEIQLQGHALDGHLSWQGGLYFENSKPDGYSGSQSPNTIHCASTPGLSPDAFECLDVLRTLAFFASGGTTVPEDPTGNIQRQLGKIEYTNRAVYAQATYDLTESLKVTGGLRYTWDETEGVSEQTLYTEFPWQPGAPAGAPGETRCVNTESALPDCRVSLGQKSSAPTWLIDFDYVPMEDVLLYAKYARGYRQGSTNLFGAQGFQEHGPEKVDSYEIGAKTQFGGPVPGTFNIAFFYNDLSDQQIQVGFRGENVTPTTGIVNAGSSKIEGLELETLLQLHPDLTLNLAYTYLNTLLEELTIPEIPPDSVYQFIIPSATAGGELSQSPKHSGTATVTYHLPLPPSIGDLSAGATYVYTDDRLIAASIYGTLEAYQLWNLNLNWRHVAGSNFDLSLFMTNVTDEEYTTFVPGLYPNLGAEFRNVGQPRMFGGRLRYRFGA